MVIYLLEKNKEFSGGSSIMVFRDLLKPVFGFSQFFPHIVYLKCITIMIFKKKFEDKGVDQENPHWKPKR